MSRPFPGRGGFDPDFRIEEPDAGAALQHHGIARHLPVTEQPRETHPDDQRQPVPQQEFRDGNSSLGCDFVHVIKSLMEWIL